MSEPSSQQLLGVRQALDGVAQSGKQLLVNQIALVQAEARDNIDSAVSRLIEAFVAILLGFCGFVVLTVSGIRVLERHVGQPLACAAVGGLYLLVSYLLAKISAARRPIIGGDS